MEDMVMSQPTSVNITHDKGNKGILITVSTKYESQELLIPYAILSASIIKIFKDQLEITNQSNEIIKPYSISNKLKKAYPKYQITEIAPNIYQTNYSSHIHYSLIVTISKYMEHRLAELHGYFPLIDILRFTKYVSLNFDESDSSIHAVYSTVNILDKSSVKKYTDLIHLTTTNTTIYKTHIKYSLHASYQHSIRTAILKKFINSITFLLLRNRSDKASLEDMYLVNTFEDINEDFRFIVRETDTYTWTLFDRAAYKTDHYELNFPTLNSAIKAALYIFLQRYNTEYTLPHIVESRFQ